ncbi:hypothetical protein SAMD00023353_8000230 [Rosellinia necatrix]|uniref:Uncharacterized protein n=1 Tax=Rosellinia necatrix TaxID=77044 RepID=A0A1S8AB81_ROSNE|nr:hypothetical protein SAMD00023353_8000230 [Rosellinia necatrix]
MSHCDGRFDNDEEQDEEEEEKKNEEEEDGVFGLSTLVEWLSGMSSSFKPTVRSARLLQGRQTSQFQIKRS